MAALSDLAVRTAKPADKPIRLYDTGGMYLEVSPSGGKLWRLKYWFEKKQKLLALGKYPEITLSDARERRDQARKLLANGVDPGAVKQAQKAAKAERAANSFEVIALEWIDKKRDGWAASHADKLIGRLKKDVFPWLGGRPIADLTAPEILTVLRRIEGRGAVDTAHRCKSDISQVIRYAIATGRAERDPCPDLRGALATPQGGHFAAVTTPAKVGELLRTMDGFSGGLIVKTALLLAPLVFVRPGELRQAEWADIDLDRAEWRFTASKTKTEHLVPLARQAVALLRDLHPLTGDGRYVFPGRPGRPLSDGAFNAALRRMGVAKEEFTMHGWRAAARTLLAEELHQKPEVIEHQLAHKVPDTLGAAYNRTKFIKERTAMMQLWADYLARLARHPNKGHERACNE
ncbi:MAG: integrase arm-type DNA-binding domain-containing protein [Azonexus sp.]|jgi:integrase|nr:integrase arm-type DNA-binding domain-containing protein [Azonexus sp.]